MWPAAGGVRLVSIFDVVVASSDTCDVVAAASLVGRDSDGDRVADFVPPIKEEIMGRFSLYLWSASRNVFLSRSSISLCL